MKKKKIGLDRKLFLKRETISALNTDQSGKVVGGWATKVRETQVDPVFEPGCMSCPPTMPTTTAPPQTNEISVCKCIMTGNMKTCTPGVTGC